MLKKFIDDECKGYIIDFRYDGVRHVVIVRATKEDVSVSQSYDFTELSSIEPLNELIVVQTVRKMLREVDKKYEEHAKNKWKIKDVEQQN